MRLAVLPHHPDNAVACEISTAVWHILFVADYGLHKVFEVCHVVDIDGGWHLPAIGRQWRWIVGTRTRPQVRFVNWSLLIFSSAVDYVACFLDKTCQVELTVVYKFIEIGT